jgi:hypothetical protein
MMTDAFAKLAAAQVVTASAFTTDKYPLGTARDMGDGQPLYAVFSLASTLAPTTAGLQFVVYAEADPVTVTITEANPGVVTLTSHGLQTGDKVYLTTSGTLPTNLTASTPYYVSRIDANTFRLSTTFANVLAGTYINTTGAVQTGTHSLVKIQLVGQSDELTAVAANIFFPTAAGSVVPASPVVVPIDLIHNKLGYANLRGRIVVSQGPLTGSTSFNCYLTVERPENLKFYRNGFTVS